MGKFLVFGLVILGIGSGFYSLVRGRELGQVKGAATAQAVDLPPTLLSVEHYQGSPFENSAEDMLKRLNATVYPQDVVKSFPDPALQIGSTITIYRATPVAVDDAGAKTTYRTWQKTAKDFFSEVGVELGDRDRVEPGLETAIAPDMTIAITRVSVVEVAVKEKIPFKTVTKNDPTIDKGTTKTAQKGEKGEKLLTYQVTRENGKEVGRKLIKTEKAKDPIDEIILRGTKEVVYGQGTATWFSAPAMTAAHNSLPRGTMVEVVNLSNNKSVVVKIIGSGIQGSAIIDLSPDAFAKLAPLGAGVINVRIVKP